MATSVELARERALARLSGMDVAAVFDLDGTGTIDPLVLQRALKRFDPSVFTDEAVDALITVMGSGGAASEEPGSIERLKAAVPHRAVVVPKAQLLLSVPPAGQRPLYSSRSASSVSTTPRGSLVPRSPSWSRHAEALDDYMDSLICDLDDFRETVHPQDLVAAAGNTPEELDALKQQLAEKAKSFMLEAQRKNVGRVWDAFDGKKQGYLALEDCAKLVKHYLNSFAPKAGEAVRGAIELGFELSTIVFEKRVADPALRRKVREQAERQIDLVHSKVAPLVQETLKKMAKEDPTEIARELLQDLDLDHDGRVSREEFEIQFVVAMQQVLGPDRLMDKVHRAKGQ